MFGRPHRGRPGMRPMRRPMRGSVNQPMADICSSPNPPGWCKAAEQASPMRTVGNGSYPQARNKYKIGT
jgi:hypothetical protein